MNFAFCFEFKLTKFLEKYFASFNFIGTCLKMFSFVCKNQRLF